MSKVQTLAMFSTHTRQSNSHFNTSQLPKNEDENFFKHVIEHLAGMKEISTFKRKQDSLSLNKIN